MNPSILGNSVQGLADFYREWKQFLLKHTPSDSPIYFMACDIQSCYDTIKARQLISIVDKKLTQVHICVPLSILCTPYNYNLFYIHYQEEYHIRNFAVVHQKGATIERTLWKKECIKGD